jgi:bleomycin hydrolase
MGANQSRPSDAAVNEKLMERLQALHMKDERPMNEKDGFVVVGGESRMLSPVHTLRTSLTY